MKDLGALLVVLALACGDDGGTTSRADADTGEIAIDILDPPGDLVGLAFGATVELRVRYRDGAQGLVGVPVGFALQGMTGGATLSATEATTAAEGIARVDLVAGSERVDFQVAVSAPAAVPVTFFVSVSDEGFAALEATPRHLGERPLEHFTVVEVRLYAAATPCATLDPAAPPPSPYPPRAMDAFDQAASYATLPAGEGYALLAWGRDDAGHVLATGCVDLAPGQVRPATTLRFDVPVADRPVVLAGSYALTSRFELGMVAAEVLAPSAWRVTTCPLGAAQLVLDCAIDLLDGGDPDDCVVESPGSLALSLGDARGALDGAGCRAATTVLGAESSDARVMAALTAAPGAPAAQLGTLAMGLAALLDQLALDSQLTLEGALLRHRLGVATLDDLEAPYSLDLALTTRPVVEALAAVTLAGTAATLDDHAFTLRLGALAGDAFSELLLAPRGLPPPSQLGTATVAAAGCTAVSAAACAPAEPAACLESACQAALALLDAELAWPFQRLSAPGLDFSLSGAATLVDDDHDLVAESLAPGSWTATLSLSDGATLPVPGTF